MANDSWKETESNIEGNLKQNPNDMQPVFRELDDLRQKDSQNMGENLNQINHQLHVNGYLPEMRLSQDGDHWSVQSACSPDDPIPKPGDAAPNAGGPIPESARQAGLTENNPQNAGQPNDGHLPNMHMDNQGGQPSIGADRPGQTPAPAGHPPEAPAPAGHPPEAAAPAGSPPEAASPAGRPPEAPAPAGHPPEAPAPAGHPPEAPAPARPPAPAGHPPEAPVPAADPSKPLCNPALGENPPHDVTAGPDAAPIPEDQHGALISKALKTAGIPDTPENASAVNRIITHESTWNPNAINDWDINAVNGHPSQGLMQTIPSTFSACAAPGLDKNIKDPLSNMVAAIRYAVTEYPNPSADPNKALQEVPGVKGSDYVGY